MKKKFIFHIHFGDKTQEVTEQNLADYASNIGLERIAPNRFSWLFVMNIILYAQRGIDPESIVDEIESLEGKRICVGTKPATMFNNEPLKGLWHKHFFSTQFVPRNLQNQHGKNGIKNLVDEVFDSSESPVVTVNMLNDLSRGVVTESLEKRGAQNRLTGEWIVFAEHENKNYYLCVSTHNEGDQIIYNQIKSICFQQFPFLDRSF